MTREWQQTKYTEYVMPDAVYYQSLWAVRDLKRMEERLREIKEDESVIKGRSMVSDNQGRKGLCQPTEKCALERLVLEERIFGIRKALETVPEKHRSFILNNIILKASGKGYPYKMWSFWKQRFLYYVAKNLSIM